MLYNTSFTNNQELTIGIAVAIFFTSIIHFTIKKNSNYSLLILSVGVLVLRLLLASLDDFLCLWDEQFHALVAKNILENPLKPTLYSNPLLQYDSNNWPANHIWLHKQPLFLWQIALSIKLLGTSVFAVKLPSALLFTLLNVAIYRIGHLTINRQTGFIAALLFSSLNFFLELPTGVIHTDHNDVSFIFYVTASIWAFTEYVFSKKTKYVYLIGLFAGFAILTKWLTGILVFSGWGLSWLVYSRGNNFKPEFINILKAFALCVLIALPWQLYILANYPSEALHEYALSSLHFSEVIEGHSGDWTYHFVETYNLFGPVWGKLLIPGLILLFLSIKNKVLRLSFLVYILAIYTFFTLAETKMPLFTTIVSPILVLGLASLFNKVFELYKKLDVSPKLYKIVTVAVLFITTVAAINIPKIEKQHTFYEENGEVLYRKKAARANYLSKSLIGKLDKNSVVFNCNEFEYIHLMFHTGCVAYQQIPNKDEILELQEKDYSILILDKFTHLPDYILSNSKIEILPNFEKGEISRKKVIIKTNTGKLIVNANYEITINTDSLLNPSIFTLIELEDDNFVFETPHSNYMCSDAHLNGELSANREKVGLWETFKIEELPNDYSAIKTSTGAYLGMNPVNNKIYATSETIGEPEKFRLEEVK